jgi:GntR family transcriptional regulator, rspAB operon transcriptional repressor
MAQQLAPLTEKPESLTQIVYQTLRGAIISKRLPPGERVSEASLARQLRVSKTPVREALLRLQAIGLVEADGGRGGRIVRPSAELIRNTYDVRGALESLCARLAARRATPAQRSQLAELADASLATAQDQDVEGFRAHDEAFHDVLATASANPYLARLIDNAYTLTGAARQRDVPSAGDCLDCATGHVQIAKAVARGDDDAAAAAAAAHVEMVGRLVLQAFLDAAEPGTSTLSE